MAKDKDKDGKGISKDTWGAILGGVGGAASGAAAGLNASGGSSSAPSSTSSTSSGDPISDLTGGAVSTGMAVAGVGLAGLAYWLTR